jgi:ATP-dependent protease ClpP protease subunit
MKKAPWYRFTDQADPAIADIHIQDAIYPDSYWDDGTVTAKQFVKDLASLPEAVKTVRVHINSPGGDVFTAVNIANALRDQRMTKGRNVETVVDGMAASAASLVMMAGSPIRIADNGMVMIHDPSSFAMGNAAEMRKTADLLDKLKDTIVATYKWRDQLAETDLVGLMAAETWMSAEEAIAAGFADEIVTGIKATASIEPGAMAKLVVPERFAGRVAELLRAEDVTEDRKADPAPKPDPAPPRATLAEVFPACKGAGLDMEFAAALLERSPLVAEVEGLVAAEKARRAAEAKRQGDIRGLATLPHLAKAKDLVEDLVSAGVTFEAAKAVMTKVAAAVDVVELDATLDPNAKTGTGGGRAAVIDINDVYARRRPR